MKKLMLCLLFACVCLTMNAQEFFRLELDLYQQVESEYGETPQLIKLPHRKATVVLAA